MIKDSINRVLNFDALAHVEETIGQPITSEKGLGLAIAANILKNTVLDELLSSTQDVHRKTTFDEYLETARQLGFVLFKRQDFQHSAQEADYMESLCFLVNEPLGLILSVESYCSTWVNKARMYFCWKPNGRRELPVRASYQYKDGVYRCSLSIDIGLRHAMSCLNECGGFLPVWPPADDIAPFIWPFNFMEDRGMDSHISTFEGRQLEIKRRLQDWPENVRRIMGSPL